MEHITKPDKPVWGGPVNEGISQSIINGFQCPFRAYLDLILGLKDNLPLHKNLIWGDCYHVGLEHLIRGASLQDAKLAAIARLKHHDQHEHSGKFEFTKDSEWSYDSYVSTIPNMLAYYDLSILPSGDWETEVVFKHPVNTGNTTYIFKGKFDGLLKNECLAEHKCKGFYGVNPDLISEEIVTDMQCNLYMTVAQVETVYYDLIGIPESVKYGAPYKAKDKSDKQYGLELIYGGTYKPNDFFPVNRNTHVWFSQRPYTLPEESQAEYWSTSIIPKVKRIHEWYDYVTSEEFDPNNPDCYNSTFYIQPVRTFVPTNTENFKCDYHGIITGQESLSNLIKKHTVFQELEVND